MMNSPSGDEIGFFAERRQEQQQWQALLDSAGEGMWGVDSEGNCTFVNRMALHIFGFSTDDMLGRNMHALVHHHYPDGTEYPAGECPVYGVFQDNQPLRQQKDLLFRKDGSSFLAEFSAQPVIVDDAVVGVVVTFRDISNQHRQQQELRDAYDLAEQRTAELEAVIESIPHGVFIATRGAAVRSNRRAREMTGDRFPAELHTLDRALGGEASTETICSSSQSIRSVAAPILLNGKIFGGVAVNTDITQARLQEDALRKAEKLAAVGQLSSSIAHEINNPLESVTNLLYLIHHSTSLDETKEYAQLAQSELSRVTEITLQTLKFHRHQSRPTRVSIADLLESILSLYTGRFLSRSVSLEKRLSQVPSVFCHEGEVRQVFNNLIRNAVDAMAAGGRLCVRLHVATNYHGRSGVRITVADSGEGIPPHIHDRLFEPFQTSKELTGTGLGLWVSKGIVDKHDGTICARTRRSAPTGTIFTVWMPLENEALYAATANQSGKSATSVN